MPTQPMPDFERMVAVAIDDAGTARDALIGRLVFYNVTDDLRVTPAELAALAASYGVSERFLPEAIEPRKVAKGLFKGTRIPHVSIGGEFWTVDMRVEEPDGKDGRLVGFLRRERRIGVRDDGREWDTRTVGNILFEPATPSELTISLVPEYAHEYPYDMVLAGVAEEYAERLVYLTGSAISELVSKMLNESASLPASPAGRVWIIPPSDFAPIDGLRDLVLLLDAEYRRPEREGAPRSRRSEFHRIDLVDGSDSRLLIRGKLEEHVTRELDEALDGLYRLLERGVRPKLAELAEAERRRADALAVLVHYEQVIGPSRDLVAAHLGRFDTLWAQVRDLRRDAGDAGADGAPED